MKDLKYLAAFIIPMLTALGLWVGGVYTFMAVGFAFLLVPLMAPWFRIQKVNLSPNDV